MPKVGRSNSASLSVCLRDSAIALHLRHTTQCVLQRVLCFRSYPLTEIPETVSPSVGLRRFPEKLHRLFGFLYTVYTFFEKSQLPH